MWHHITMRFPPPLSTLRFVRYGEHGAWMNYLRRCTRLGLVDLRVNDGAAPETSERYMTLLQSYRPEGIAWETA